MYASIPSTFSPMHACPQAAEEMPAVEKGRVAAEGDREIFKFKANANTKLKKFKANANTKLKKLQEAHEAVSAFPLPTFAPPTCARLFCLPQLCQIPCWSLRTLTPSLCWLFELGKSLVL
jgi:hypothetical protein